VNDEHEPVVSDTFTKLLNPISIVSETSSVESSATLQVKDFDVSPGIKVNVPPINV